MCDTCRNSNNNNDTTTNDTTTNMNYIIHCQPGYSDSPFREYLMSKILDHPNILKLRDFSIQHRRLLQGCDKWVHYTSDKTTPIENIRDKINIELKRKLFIDIISAVVYLCDRKVYHQNIKPENISVRDNIAYLSGFGDANAPHVVRASWIDPDITVEYYQTWKFPTKDKLVMGNLWSLGMFGIWLFCDKDVYDWANENADDEEIVFGYFMRGRWGFGIKGSGVNTDGVPNDIITLLNMLINPRLYIREQIKSVPLNNVNSSEVNNEVSEVNIGDFNKLLHIDERINYIEK